VRHCCLRLCVTALLAALALGEFSLPAQARHEKLSKDLHGITGNGVVDVVIQFRQHPSPAKHQHIQNMGGVLKSELPAIHAAAYHVPASVLERSTE